MLVLIGPPFRGEPGEYVELAKLTRQVIYDLKTKLKPDTWGVVRALNNSAQAHELAQLLGGSGFRTAVVQAQVGHDASRAIIPLRSLELKPDGLDLHLQERVISVPWGSLLVIVQGQNTDNLADGGRGRSSSSLRAVNPTRAEMDAFREAYSAAGSLGAETYLVADIHFITVPWIARIDARHFDFASVGLGDDLPIPERLAACILQLASAAGVRVDAGSKSSSLNGFVEIRLRSITPHPAAVASGELVSAGLQGDGVGPATEDLRASKFDVYSRLVGEAERLSRPSSQGSQGASEAEPVDAG